MTLNLKTMRAQFNAMRWRMLNQQSFGRLLRCCPALILVMSFVMAATAAPVSKSYSQAAATSKSRITTASSVRVRDAAQVSGAEIARLPLGTIVRELEQSASKEQVGTAEDFWYRISAPNGVEGWVFGALTAPYTPARREEIYLRVANERLKIEAASFNDAADLYTFLDRAVKETTQRNALAELELLRLLALQKSLALIQMSKMEEPPYQAWTKAQGDHIVYSEPSGQWYVRADSFWNLEKKYRAQQPVIAERIAWEASKIPLPGECEGYLPCHLSYEAETSGEYLKLYPRGVHAATALDSISESFKQVLDDFKNASNSYDVPKEERAAFHKQVADFRLILTRVPNPKSALAVSQLDQINRHFK